MIDPSINSAYVVLVKYVEAVFFSRIELTVVRIMNRHLPIK